jgi:gluconolactonase
MRLGLAFLISLLAAVLLPLAAPAQKPQSFKLEPFSPKFEDLIASGAKLETVATGFGFTEGPMRDPAGFL